MDLSPPPLRKNRREPPLLGELQVRHLVCVVIDSPEGMY